ncbi:MAG: chloroperoxidase [Vicinamibacteria bacterium]
MFGFRPRPSAGAVAALSVFTAVSVGAAERSQKSEPLQAYPGQQYESLIQPENGVPLNPHHSANAADRLRYWNQVAVDSSGLDHTPVAPGESRLFGHQLGPGRSARAMAIVHIAMADSVASIKGGFKRYTPIPNAPAGASVDTAIATAASATLIAMFPSHKPRLLELYAADLVDAPGTVQEKAKGVLVGTLASAAILALRHNDGSNHPEDVMNTDYIPGDGPGEWRQDPISQSPVALGSHWADVKPFVLASAAQFRLPPPPVLGSAAYATAFNEVKALGGDGVNTPTSRTADQTQAGIYWAYDGTPSLCAPPRLYNQVATKLTENETSVVKLARMYALVNLAMADAGIASWESKFFYKFWRPVTAIREADPGTGPMGGGDGNPATIGDVDFHPLGAPASNLTGPNFTPPFPAYPSGHATFGGTLFQVMRRILGTDNVTFTFTSDEYNGTTVGNDGEVRPLLPRTFTKLSQAEEENGQSRIYLGIHWSFDKTEGIKQGRQVANYVVDRAFKPTN